MKKLLPAIFIVATLFSCVNTTEKSDRLSLAEFSKTVESKEEKDFFLANKPTDNTSIFKEFLNNSTAMLISKPGIRFKWSGFEGGGCETPLRLCIILGKANESFSKALVTQFRNKLIILPMDDEYGLTSDGFMPIYSDVLIDSLTSKELALKHKFVKAGIYKANYDSKQKGILELH